MFLSLFYKQINLPSDFDTSKWNVVIYSFTVNNGTTQYYGFDGEASYSYVCDCEGWNKQDLIEYKIEKLQNEINGEYEKLKSLQKNSLMNIMKDRAREKIESAQEEIRDISKKFCDFNGKSFGVNKVNDYLDKIAKEAEKKNLDDKIN